jgi:hypothetical protein
MAAMGSGNVPGSWQSVGLFSSSRITIQDLVPGSTYAFQVRAIGSTGRTDWSNPVSRMCA